MKVSELKEGEEYVYHSAYGKSPEIWKCLKVWYSESEEQWWAKFEILTDPDKCNRIGLEEDFNEIEIKLYIHPRSSW